MLAASSAAWTVGVWLIAIGAAGVLGAVVILGWTMYGARRDWRRMRDEQRR